MSSEGDASFGDRPDEAGLAARMAGLGMALDVEPDREAEIEGTLVHVSEVGMEGDLRVLSVLTTWMGVHHAFVNADRLVRIVGPHPSDAVRRYWSAIASWIGKNRRFARLVMEPSGDRLDLLPVGTEFQVARRGEDERFEGSPLHVPKGALRERESDVLPPEDLVRVHPGYRNHVLMGPSYRADVWTLLERRPDARIADLAREAHCSFATAWPCRAGLQAAPRRRSSRSLNWMSSMGSAGGSRP